MSDRPIRDSLEDLADAIISQISYFDDYPERKRQWLLTNLTTAYMRGVLHNANARLHKSEVSTEDWNDACGGLGTK